jgi:hypothetical protein
MKQSITYELGFADAEVLGYQKKGNDAKVSILAWNEDILEITFLDCIGICDIDVGDISSFVEESSSNLLSNVMAKMYEKPPTTHQYKPYQFLDQDDQVSLEIVAASFTIKRLSSAGRLPDLS